MEFLKDLSIDKIRNVAEDVYNQTKPKSDVEARVYEVLSHKNWGASSTLLNDIARDTFDSEKFYIITKLIWDNLENPRPSAWRVVFKGLTLLEHLIKNGSERCVDDARNHSHALRGLYNFNYYEGTIDRGIGVRELSKKIVDILSDDDTIRDERAKARQLREKFGTRMDAVGSSIGSSHSSTHSVHSSSYAGYGYDSDGRDRDFTSSGSGSKAHFGGRYSDTSSSFHESPVSVPPPQPPSSSSYSSKTITSNSNISAKAVNPDTLDNNDLQKKIKKKKKPQEQHFDISTTYAIDLLSFDAPTKVSGYDNQASVGLDDDFDAFQSAPTPAAVSSSSKVVSQLSTNIDPFDAFGNFTSAPISTASSSLPSKPLPSSHQATFDAFTTPVVSTNLHHLQDSFSHMNVSYSTSKPMGLAQSNKTGVNMMIQPPPQQQIHYHPMSNSSGKQTSITPGMDDEFGEFEDAAATSKRSDSSSSTLTGVDPINKLISLDSLTSYKKKEDKLKAPIIYNDMAAQFVKEKQSSNSTLTASTTQSKTSPFLGVDGLQKPLNIMSHDSTSYTNHPRVSGTPIMSSTSLTSGGNATMISMMAQPNINPMMTTTQPSSLNGMSVNGPYPINMMGSTKNMLSMNNMNPQNMMGGNSMTMMSGGMNTMQYSQTQQPFSMNQTIMNSPNMGNINPMGYNNQNSNSNSTNRMGGAPMSGW